MSPSSRHHVTLRFQPLILSLAMLLALTFVVLQQCPPPTVTLTIAPGAGQADANGNRLPRVSWAVTCPQQGGACPNTPTASLTDLGTEFAARPTERLGSGTGFSGASGEGPLPGMSAAVVGAHLQFSALAECNNPGSSVRATSAPVVFAPVLLPGEAFVAGRAADDSITDVVQPQAIPAGKRVELRPSFEVELAPDEPALVRVQGAGVDWSKTYSFPNRRGATGLKQALMQDPQARFTFSQAGTVAMTVELAGVRSAAANFTVAGTSPTTGGGSGGAGGGSGGGGGGGGAPAGGCSSAPGVLLLGVLAVLRRRSSRP